MNCKTLIKAKIVLIKIQKGGQLLTAESILKRVHSAKKKEAGYQEQEKTSTNRDFHCKVCLIRENDNLPKILINNSEKVYQLIKDELAPADREIMLSIMLDTKLYLIAIETVAIGRLNVCGSTATEVFKSAILANSACIILVHNHPSGDFEPSNEDIAFTKNMIKCGQLLGIKVQDHLIISGRGYISMSERGLIRP